MPKKEKIKKITEKFLKKLMIESEVVVIEKEDNITVRIDSEEAGILIGKNGETLRALQHLLRLSANKVFADFVSLSVDIAGYKDRRRQDLETFATRAAETVIKSGRAQVLEPMNSFERRIVHMFLSERKDIETESVGAEPNRRVIVRKKKKELVA
jgi:spoIIIJ-associated protein